MQVNPAMEHSDEEHLLKDQFQEKPNGKEGCCTKEKRKSWCLSISICSLILYIIGVIFMFIWISLTNRRVIELYGDSLVDVPCQNYHINSKLRDDFYYIQPHYITEVNYYGVGGARISDLKNMLSANVLHRFDYTTPFTWQYAAPPDGLVLYWDSDVNPGPRDGSSPLNNATVSAYLQNLYDVLDQLTSHCDVVILAVPTLSGELPNGQNPLDEALNYYVQLNNATATRYNITYINTRALYYANLPAGWNQTSGYLTLDGEHPNQRGSTLLRTAFREALMNSPLW